MSLDIEFCADGSFSQPVSDALHRLPASMFSDNESQTVQCRFPICIFLSLAAFEIFFFFSSFQQFHYMYGYVFEFILLGIC